MSSRSAILAAARKAFERDGEAGLSLRDVAARVGLTPMAIYRHFANKQALIDALHSEAIQDWRARVASVTPGEPRAWLHRIGNAYLDFALREPRRYEAAFLVSAATALRYPDDFLAGASPAVMLQLELIKQFLAPEARGKDALAELLIAYAALSQGLVSLYRAGRIAGGERKFRALYRRAMERCVRSFVLEQPK